MVVLAGSKHTYANVWRGEYRMRGGLQSAVTPAVEHPWRPRSTACVLAQSAHWWGLPLCQLGQSLVSSCAQVSAVGAAALAPAHAKTSSIETNILRHRGVSEISPQ